MVLSGHGGETDDQQEKTQEKTQETASSGGESPSLSLWSVNIQRVLSPPSLPSPGLECRVLESGTAMCIECSARAVEGKLIVLCVWDLVRVLWCSVYH